MKKITLSHKDLENILQVIAWATTVSHGNNSFSWVVKSEELPDTLTISLETNE